MADVKVIFSVDGVQYVVNATQQVNQALDGVSKKQGELGGSAEGMAGSMGDSFKAVDFAAKFHLAQQVAGYVADAGKAIIQFSQEGAALTRIEEAGESLATSMGLSMTDIMNSVRTTSLGMVSDADLMASANRALMLGVAKDAESMGQLIEVAAIRGRAMGLSTKQAFDDIVTGIGRASPQILDNLGIITDADVTYSNYAASIGKAADELSKAEKQQALLNAVLESTAPMLEQTNGLVLDSAGAWEKLNAQMKNYWDNLKKDVGGSEVTLGYVGAATEAVSRANIRQMADDAMALAHRLGMVTDAEYNWYRVPILTTHEAKARWLEILTPKLEAYAATVEATANGTKTWTDNNYESAESLGLQAEAQSNAGKVYEENVEAMKNDLANLRTEYEETALALADANLTLEVAVQTFYESVGDKLVKGLKDAGLEGEALEQRLGILDDLLGTSYVMEYKLELATDDLLETLINDPDAFAAKFKAFDNIFTPLNKAVAAAMTEVGNLEGQLDALNGKIVEVEIMINMTRGTGKNTGSSTTNNRTPGTGYELPDPRLQALGGPVYENTPYIVGERGPELFVPNSQGSIIPNYMLGGETNASFDIDYQRLGRVISESIIEAAEEGRIGNNYMINENGRREMMNNNFELLRAYGSNR